MDYSKLKFNDLRAKARKAGMFNASTAKASDMRDYLIAKDKEVSTEIEEPKEVKVKVEKKKPIAKTKTVKADHKAPKHYTMYLMSKDGSTPKDIAQALMTNVGHVWNELNKYKNDPKRAEKYSA